MICLVADGIVIVARWAGTLYLRQGGACRQEPATLKYLYFVLRKNVSTRVVKGVAAGPCASGAGLLRVGKMLFTLLTLLFVLLFATCIHYPDSTQILQVSSSGLQGPNS